MLDFGTIVPTALMTTHMKGLQQSEGKTEIEMLHCHRKWNYRANSEESVAAWPQKQRRQKTNKDDRNKTGGHLGLCIKFILMFTLALVVCTHV
jgi:hypothetical protein